MAALAEVALCSLHPMEHLSGDWGAMTCWEQRCKDTQLPGSPQGFLRVTTDVGSWPDATPASLYQAIQGDNRDFRPATLISDCSQRCFLQRKAFPAAVSLDTSVTNSHLSACPRWVERWRVLCESPQGSLPTGTAHSSPAECLS